MNDTVIQVADLSKRYRLGVVGTGTLSHDLNRWWAKVRGRPDPTLKVGQAAAGSRQLPVDGDRPPSSDYMWALKDVSFEVRRGEILGIIGRNGAGKSTLLKILSRVTAPTSGEVRVRGRIASLLEVGTGFHPELTGRENILLNGAILGMRKAEIACKFDEIVAFSGVEEYIDTPVKRYSSGMYVRLAFAVAAHLEPEILIVDEVLAVGDAEFQKKCLGKMGDVAKGGRTVLFVSHNMAAITRLCPKTLLLDSGACAFQGNTDEAITYYLQSATTVCRSYVDLREAPGLDVNRKVILTWISTHRLDGTESSEFNTGDGITFRIGYHLDGKIAAYVVIIIFNNLGERLITLQTSHGGPPLQVSGDGVIQCSGRDIRLMSGEYTILLDFGRELPQVESLDCVPEATRFRVNLGDYLSGSDLVRGHGVMAQRSEWSVTVGETYGPGLRTGHF